MAGEKVMEADATNLRSIAGILMFGVPSKGMAVESLLPMTRQNPNEALLQTLSTSSEMLRSQCEKFENALPFKDSKVFSFYETKQSPTASKVNCNFINSVTVLLTWLNANRKKGNGQ